MSQWVKGEISIKDLSVFIETVKKEGLLWFDAGTDAATKYGRGYRNLAGVFMDRQGQHYSNQAIVVQDKNGYRIDMDNDASYSALARKYGRGCGKLLQIYGVNMVKRAASRRGGHIQSHRELADGSVVLRVTMGR